jgi:hypothetical protein
MPGASMTHHRVIPAHRPAVCPRVPRTIQTIQSGLVGCGSEVVQIEIGGCYRRVAHPSLNGHHVHPAGQPQTGSGIPQIVDATPLCHRRPVKCPLERARVQPGAGLRQEQPLIGTAAVGTGSDQRQHSISDWDPSGSVRLGCPDPDALRLSAVNNQHRQRHLDEVAHPNCTQLRPPQAGPGVDEY